MTIEILSRIQFAFTVTFHIIWPLFNVGLILFLIIVECIWFKTRNDVYAKIYHFWAKIFALSFSVGVVSGIVMSYQFGTNMSKFFEFAAPFIAPVLGTEVLTAFFLEAVFLGIMLFGWGKVPPALHLASTILVGVGVHNSVIWIISVVSWMHTPAGIAIENGNMVVTSFYEAILNPSFLDRLGHMLLACYITASFIVMGISAIYILRNQFVDVAKKSYKICFILLSFLLPTMFFFGDSSGLLLKKYQPAKLAAIEGLWETSRGVPTLVFAIPDFENERNAFELGIPYGTSLLLTHSFDGEIQGLKDFPKELRPSKGAIITSFISFRLMFGLWVLMVALWIVGLILSYKGTIFKNRTFMKMHVLMIPSGWIAGIAGWYVTELGRQPWVIYNIMKIKDAISPTLSFNVVLWSLITFIIVDTIVLIIYSKYIWKFINSGPKALPQNYVGDK